MLNSLNSSNVAGRQRYKFPSSCIVVVFLVMAAASRAAFALSTSTRVMAPVATEITLQCSDGIRLAGQSWTHPDTSLDDSKRNRILCLHGWMDNSASFHQFAPALVERLPNTELIALDLVGHGKSSHKSKDGAPVVLAEHSYYVAEAVQQLQWQQDKQLTLIGHSMGAAVSCLYAAAFPEHVKQLVLLEGAGPLARNTDDIAKHVRNHISRRLASNQNGKPVRVYDSIDKAVQIRQQTARNFPGDQTLSKEAARAMVLRGSNPVTDGGLQFCHDPRLQMPSLLYFSQEQTESLYKGK